MGAGSCSSQLSAYEQQMPVARKWQKSYYWGRKNVDCGAGTGTNQSKSNPCVPLFQLPAGNADGLISSVLLSLFLLKALLTLRGPHVCKWHQLLPQSTTYFSKPFIFKNLLYC